jgi:hypothetical protein
LAEATIGRGPGSSGEVWQRCPIGAAIHMCMETTLGISLYTYPYLKLAKKPRLSYYLLCFLFNKIGEQEQVPARKGVVGWWGREEWGGGTNNVYTSK